MAACRRGARPAAALDGRTGRVGNRAPWLLDPGGTEAFGRAGAGRADPERARRGGRRPPGPPGTQLPARVRRHVRPVRACPAPRLGERAARLTGRVVGRGRRGRRLRRPEPLHPRVRRVHRRHSWALSRAAAPLRAEACPRPSLGACPRKPAAPAGCRPPGRRGTARQGRRRSTARPCPARPPPPPPPGRCPPARRPRAAPPRRGGPPPRPPVCGETRPPPPPPPATP